MIFIILIFSRFRFLRMTGPSHKSRALESYLLNLIKDFSILFICLVASGHAPVVLKGSLWLHTSGYRSVRRSKGISRLIFETKSKSISAVAISGS